MAERETRRVAHELIEEPTSPGDASAFARCMHSSKSRVLIPKRSQIVFNLGVADVYHALAYYHDHPREMSDVEAERVDAFDTFRELIERPDGIEPDTA